MPLKDSISRVKWGYTYIRIVVVPNIRPEMWGPRLREQLERAAVHDAGSELDPHLLSHIALSPLGIR